MSKLSMLSLFEQSEIELKTHLSGLVLPRDVEKLNSILSDLFIEHIKIEKYKQELTNPEIAIFQSAIRLVEESLRLQQNMFDVKTDTLVTHKPISNQKKNLPVNKSQVAMVGATATGILAGAITNIGTILLSIVTTAVGVWITSNGHNTETIATEKIVEQGMVVNADAIIGTTKKICQLLDQQMEIYQTNIFNLKTRLENRQVPTLYNSYGYLLNRLAILYRDKTNSAPADEIEDDIAKLFRTLKNYNYEFVNYSEETQSFFDVETIEDIQNPEVAEVAILENGECVVKGKFYQPKK